MQPNFILLKRVYLALLAQDPQAEIAKSLQAKHGGSFSQWKAKVFRAKENLIRRKAIGLRVRSSFCSYMKGPGWKSFEDELRVLTHGVLSPSLHGRDKQHSLGFFNTTQARVHNLQYTCSLTRTAPPCPPPSCITWDKSYRRRGATHLWGLLSLKDFEGDARIHLINYDKGTATLQLFLPIRFVLPEWLGDHQKWFMGAAFQVAQLFTKSGYRIENFRQCGPTHVAFHCPLLEGLPVRGKVPITEYVHLDCSPGGGGLLEVEATDDKGIHELKQISEGMRLLMELPDLFERMNLLTDTIPRLEEKIDGLLLALTPQQGPVPPSPWDVNVYG